MTSDLPRTKAGRGQVVGRLGAVAAALWLAVPLQAALSLVESDLCVYGGTSGGVIAAVQAARMGKSAVLVVFNNHVGGMTSGGLGATDIGAHGNGYIGGLSREFYRRIGQRYGMAERFQFEPHVAEEVFNEMLAGAGVAVYTNQRLASVSKEGARIMQITMEDGTVFRAKIFLDTTYEGDLMAMAGVRFTVGREGTNTYGESLNGVRPGAQGHQFTVNVDPYVIAGDTNSGLLPFIQPPDNAPIGSADHRVQAYNFRLCFTQTASNRLAILPPANYSEARYELLGRLIDARLAAGHSLNLRSFMNIASMPNGKTDINNNGAFSTDFIGMNYTYPTNTYAERERVWREHLEYIQGFLHYLATSPRVPAAIRAEMQSWGPCRDEFPDTGGWPHQMYVREGRRMVSDYVMTQHDCLGTRVAPDSVGLAAYNMDSHNCQRTVQGGHVRNEGDVQTGVPRPFPISYRSLVPRAAECENLLVTFALSSSHISFSSVRMEPVFMITSHSAATAAAFALDERVPVQQVNYDKLALQLVADQQVLKWGSTPMPGEVIVDNSDPTGVVIVGVWTNSTSRPGYWGSNYIHDGNTGKGAKSVRFIPNLPSNGVYEVALRWTTDPNRATNVPVDIVHPAGTNTVFVNQQTNNGTWVPLLTTNFLAGTNASVLLRTDNTTGYVIGDAVRFVPLGWPAAVVQVVATDPMAAEHGRNPGLISVVRTGETNAWLTVRYALSGTAGNGTDFAALSGSVVFSPGLIATTVVVVPLPDAVVEGPETMVLTLLPGAGYVVGSQSHAAVTLLDKPFDAWRHARFTAAELADPLVSGEDADPDGDGAPNYREYALGLNPRGHDGTNRPLAVLDGGFFRLTYTRLKSATDVTYGVEASEDLASWSRAGGSDELLADDGTVQMWRSGVATSGAAQQFLRLRVSRP